MTGVKYLREFLQPYLSLWWAAFGGPLNFMDDEDRHTRASADNEYLETEGTHRLDWPALSLYMKPIE